MRPTPMILCALLVLAGCKTVQDAVNDAVADAVTDAVTTTTTTTTTTTQPDVVPPVQADSQRFLWKPTSENDGKLVVIFPARIKGGDCYAGPDKGRYSSTANGNRRHYRFGKPGAAYGSNVLVRCVSNGADVATWTVPDGAKRWEK